MKNFSQFVTKYPLSALCLVLIAVLSLAPFFPETPLDDVAFIDKWTHLVMYGGTAAVVWLEYLRHHPDANLRRILWIVIIGLSALGGLMELLQAYCTTTRSGEWLDFSADTVGVLLGTAIGIMLGKVIHHKG